MAAAPPPAFFIPGIAHENQEAVYSDIARLMGSTVPKEGNRIYRITFMHNGEEWTACVGQRLKGARWRIKGPKGAKVERKQILSNSSTVVAIFPGDAYYVYHDNVSEEWHNPFKVGNPSDIQLFVRPKIGAYLHH